MEVEVVVEVVSALGGSGVGRMVAGGRGVGEGGSRIGVG